MPPDDAADDAAEVIDLDAERRKREFQVADSMSRHPAGHRSRRVFRKPQNSD